MNLKKVFINFVKCCDKLNINNIFYAKYVSKKILKKKLKKSDIEFIDSQIVISKRTIDELLNTFNGFSKSLN